MDHAEAIPVDTHVWQIASRDYGFGKKQNKTLTTLLYNEIGGHFRTLFGQHSGWAHSVSGNSNPLTLFFTDLLHLA
jgi:N-glycosylase/DNA lyase